MGAREALDVYLNDHLAGSVAAVDLVERIRANSEGSALDAVLAGLGRDIEADRATLTDVMERLGVRSSTPKQVAGKVAETLSRFRLNERITGSADVSRLMEIETLALGIEGKLALWRSLDAAASAWPELGSFDLPGLVDRAVSQREALEPFRLEAAARAFGRSGTD